MTGILQSYLVSSKLQIKAIDYLDLPYLFYIIYCPRVKDLMESLFFIKRMASESITLKTR